MDMVRCVTEKSLVQPGMALCYPQLEGDCAQSFNRFYQSLAAAAQSYAQSCRETDSRSFYRMQCTTVETENGDLSVTVSLFHRMPSQGSSKRTLCQLWRDGLLLSATH